MENRKAKLLIIDDEPDLVEALQLRFMSSGFEVETAPDGDAGLDKVRSWMPDVVLLDVAMPKLSGWEVCRALRSEGRTRELPVVVMTAAILPDVEERARECGASAIVRKPFDDRQLVRTVRDQLEHRTGVP